MMIDFLKIADALNIIPIASILGFLLLISLWLIIAIIDFYDKNKIICILLSIFIAFAPYLFMENFGIQKEKAILRKYNVSNVKNLKNNIEIIRNATKFNSEIKDKEEYVNRILNKFYLGGKEVTVDEKELMKKLKK